MYEPFFPNSLQITPLRLRASAVKPSLIQDRNSFSFHGNRLN